MASLTWNYMCVYLLISSNEALRVIMIELHVQFGAAGIMTTILNLRTSWDITKSSYDEIDELPLMTTPGPVLMVLALYLLFVLKLGPNFMRKRPAFKLTRTLFAYNAIQVVVSVYLVQKYFRGILAVGITPRKCYINEIEYRSEIIFGTWLYFAAKISELLDTVFFVLRKKDNQVTFLHVYHHSIMVIGTWGFCKYSPSHTVVFIGFLNSLVHVFMYTYYGLAALGPNVAKYLTWKKYMTSFQLIQFVSFIAQYAFTVKVSECPPSLTVAAFMLGNITFFLILFSNFYIKCYLKDTKTSSNSNHIALHVTEENFKKAD